MIDFHRTDTVAKGSEMDRPTGPAEAVINQLRTVRARIDGLQHRAHEVQTMVTGNPLEKPVSGEASCPDGFVPMVDWETRLLMESVESLEIALGALEEFLR